MLSFWRVALSSMLISFSLFCLSSHGLSQENAAQQESFDQVFAEWKDLLKELRDLRARFDIAEEAEVAEIRDRYNQCLQVGHEMIPRLRETALRKYLAAPNTDPGLTRFLIKLADDGVKTDQYDAAFQISDALLRNNCDEKKLYDLAGTAAFCTNRFDAADKYLQQAAQLGVLERGENYLPSVATAKENWREELKIREAEAKADDLPRVRLTTDRGDIVLELFENEAPATVGNFIQLVEKGFYDGLTFHRVLPGFMAQTGCPNGDGSGGPGYTIFCETQQDQIRRHFAGSLSMAKTSDPNTGGSQFFMTFVPTSGLDGQHTVFGRILEGQDRLARIQRRDPDHSEQLIIIPDKILKAEVIRKRPNRQYAPNKSSQDDV
ncbi:MAG: peptidylprolyl isomerase [Pirellulaceae bacterium]|nr:peptidylprolyl isomerase [Pirellulaceae bacterium]